ncbi:MAG: transaldolase [Gammaproteobacteria bacterium]|nr:transaldolase [Gammaproteobacteria bacterium]MBQ0840186.1 transaldolase [Gammaproteobacteria bacterium]
MSTKLQQLKTMTSVVADTGDINAIATYQPEDATTNPSLILKAAQMPEYQQLLQETCAQVSPNSDDPIADACDRVAVGFGCEILKLIPGVVSTEVDARLSFDSEASIARAHKLIDLYQQQGIAKERVLIKIAATWEGIQAAKALQKAGIRCNLTLLFNLAQAAAAADAGAHLISPFVGRIHDWYKQRSENAMPCAELDPGVISVSSIYDYYKSHGYKTIIMGASFRNTGQIEALAGCDKLTISPGLLANLEADTGDLQRQLGANNLANKTAKLNYAASNFRLDINNDAMASEKLAEGIRLFIRDQLALEQMLTPIMKGQAA